MSNFPMLNDKIYTWPIQVANSAGAIEPAIAGDVYSVAADLPASINAVIGATDATNTAFPVGTPAVVANALVAASPGRTITVSDSKGLAVSTTLVDVVADVTPTNVVLDIAGGTTTDQPVPTAPGP